MTILKDLPNKLTLARMAVVPLLILLFSIGFSGLYPLCSVLFMIAAMTDFLDGFLARKYELTTRVGALLDPIADKILIGSALILLAYARLLPLWMASILLCREIGVSGLRLVALERQVSVPVSQLGKWKTFLQSVGISCVMMGRQLFGWPWREVGMIAMWLALFVSLYSAYEYGKATFKHFN